MLIKNAILNLEVEKDVYSSGDIIKGKITFENPLKKDIDKVEVEIDGTESVVVTENEQPIQSIVEQYKYPINGNWRAGDSKIFELKIPLLKQVTKQNILNTIGRYFQRYTYLFLGAISFIAIMLRGRLGASIEQKDMLTLSISLIGCIPCVTSPLDDASSRPFAFHGNENLFII